MAKEPLIIKDLSQIDLSDKNIIIIYDTMMHGYEIFKKIENVEVPVYLYLIDDFDSFCNLEFSSDIINFYDWKNNEELQSNKVVCVCGWSMDCFWEYAQEYIDDLLKLNFCIVSGFDLDTIEEQESYPSFYKNVLNAGKTRDVGKAISDLSLKVINYWKLHDELNGEEILKYFQDTYGKKYQIEDETIIYL